MTDIYEDIKQLDEAYGAVNLQKTMDAGKREQSQAAALFYVVWSLYKRGSDDFAITGIFSKEVDAHALKERLDGDSSCLAASVDRWPMPDIIEHLVRDRLGKMADLLLPIESAIRAFINEKKN